ncbi:hypothetical protein BDB00DRAFT_875250 [Zychaea mexicana]|uniref:uncharacterized protein n=1 Tax=Zychaea mexicana TaxID=64656 RepID=UPI0022FEE3F2|nr:uncharacterized protein BDB00DRAFT_875250 [Zychaea mexicana]KAI9490509.1 hypothetical protein BDB00DRAFT_875250 [Zychaea mexicana]
MSTKQNVPEHMRWYVVGAHLAGAVDSQIVEMTDLTKGSIRQIIQNFKRTGSPSIARLAPPDDPHYAVIAETALDNSSNTAADTEQQDHKSKRRRVGARRFTANQVVQHILDESEKNGAAKPSHGTATTKSTKSTGKKTKKEWTREDDSILLQHAWTRFPRAGGRWHEAETKMEKRHTAKECQDRWDVVRPIMMDAINRYGTEGW